MNSARAIAAVWQRHFTVFRRSWVYGAVTTFVTPLIYLSSFAFGMSHYIGSVSSGGKEVSYQGFVFAGILGQTLLFQAFFEGAYGGFVRMYYQKIFKSIALTPITLTEILIAEISWHVTRALASVVVLLALGIGLGQFSVAAAISCVPIAIISAALFSSLGLVSAAYARTIEELSYPQLLFILPMTLFCGVYYPIDSMNPYLRYLVEVLPLTSTVAILRGILLETPIPWFAPVNLTLWTLVFVPWSISALKKRITK